MHLLDTVTSSSLKELGVYQHQLPKSVGHKKIEMICSMQALQSAWFQGHNILELIDWTEKESSLHYTLIVSKWYDYIYIYGFSRYFPFGDDKAKRRLVVQINFALFTRVSQYTKSRLLPIPLRSTFCACSVMRTLMRDFQFLPYTQQCASSRYVPVQVVEFIENAIAEPTHLSFSSYSRHILSAIRLVFSPGSKTRIS